MASGVGGELPCMHAQINGGLARLRVGAGEHYLLPASKPLKGGRGDTRSQDIHSSEWIQPSKLAVARG
jgi:hypothetical protein